MQAILGLLGLLLWGSLLGLLIDARRDVRIMRRELREMREELARQLVPERLNR